jgi:hypothetical protein
MWGLSRVLLKVWFSSDSDYIADIPAAENLRIRRLAGKGRHRCKSGHFEPLLGRSMIKRTTLRLCRGTDGWHFSAYWVRFLQAGERPRASRT